MQAQFSWPDSKLSNGLRLRIRRDLTTMGAFCSSLDLRTGRVELFATTENQMLAVAVKLLSCEHQEVIHPIFFVVFLLDRPVTCLFHFANDHIAADAVIGAV